MERGQETLDAEVEKQREEARRDVHDNKVKFGRWVDSIGGILDEEGLVPFTRWITPAGLPRRFTTQMYLYFLPVRVGGKVDEVKVPTSDGGIEHTTAEFRSPEAWLKLARKGEVELYPPQFLLLSLVAKFLQSSGDGVSIKELKKQREDLLEFVRKGNWGERCVSPRAVHRPGGKKMVFVFDFSGKEVKNEGRTGIDEFVMRVEMKKEGGVRALEVLRREDVFGSKGKI